MRISLIDRHSDPARRRQHRLAVTFFLLPAMLAGLLLPTIVAAQVAADEAAPANQQPITARTHPNEPELWNADQMMEDAAKQIARRYNLNKAQENFTRMLLRERTLAFLDEYETDVRELLKESIDFRLGLKPATPEALQDWASRALPVYEAAKQAILDGNDEWRDILDDAQMKIHDTDLRMMEVNFAQVTRMLTDWEEGKGTFGRTTRKQTIQSSGGPDETTGEVSQPRQPNQSTYERRRMEDSWLAYVNKFIQVYKLNEEKANAARAGIHKEMLSKAVAYRAKHKAKFNKLQAEIMAPPKPGQEAKQTRRIRKELQQRKSELERPIRVLFVEMDKRLRELPTTTQLASADPNQKKTLDELYSILAGDAAPGGGKLDAKAGTSQPASTQPTTSQPAAAGEHKPAETKDEPEPKSETAKPVTEAKDKAAPQAADKPAASPAPVKKTSEAPAKESGKASPEKSGKDPEKTSKGPVKEDHEQ